MANDDEAKAIILTYLYRMLRTTDASETYWGQLYWEIDTLARQHTTPDPVSQGAWLRRLLDELVHEGKLTRSVGYYRLTARQWLKMLPRSRA